uniref:Cas12f1-like TNB domain-containing protein n=1 Tax=Archaeoglobus fulgidus TaxID=2234 RepID=A0A7J2TJ51_ARCFL
MEKGEGRSAKSEQLDSDLHSSSFGKLQFFIEYKARFEGLLFEYVNPQSNSGLCPICGEKLAQSALDESGWRIGAALDLNGLKTKAYKSK